MYPIKSYNAASKSTNTSSSASEETPSQTEQKRQTAPQDSSDLKQIFSSPDSVEEAFLQGNIPEDNASRFRIISKLLINDKLETLNWMDANGSVTGCSNLYNKKNLEKFIKWVGEASNVTSLNLSGNDIGKHPDYVHETGEGVFIETGSTYDISPLAILLEYNKSITRLNLSRNMLLASHIEALAITLNKNSTLTELDISKNKGIDNNGIKKLLAVLSDNEKFKLLKLTANSTITPAIVSALKKDQIHYSLHLSHSELNKNCAKDILTTLQSNISLPELKINESINPTKDIDMQISESYKSYMQYNQSYKKAGVLKGILENNRTLTLLDFSGNQIGHKGIAAISTALESNTTLKSLGISIVGLDNLKIFLQAIKNNTTLRSLNLYASDIGREGIKAIAKFLMNNKTLTSLSLSSCKTSENIKKQPFHETLISDQDTQVIAKAFITNNTLTSLDLSNNFIGAKGAKVLINAIKKHKCALTSINISDTQSSKDINAALEPNINAQVEAGAARYIDLCLRHSPQSKQILSIPEINAKIAQQLRLISFETALVLNRTVSS